MPKIGHSGYMDAIDSKEQRCHYFPTQSGKYDCDQLQSRLRQWQQVRSWARLIREAENLWHVDVKELRRIGLVVHEEEDASRHFSSIGWTLDGEEG